RPISDFTQDERGALAYRPIKPGREVVEHHAALAGTDERMTHVASDIAATAGNQDRHAGDPLLSPSVAGSDVGNVRLGRACTGWRPLTSRLAPNGSGGRVGTAGRRGG